MSIQIHGKNYTMVAERLEMVHASGKSFEVVESAPFQAGDRWLWRCVVKIDERIFVGNAEVKLANARPGTPDASNPYECAETSALGRALGFSGFGAMESIASADEITRSQATPAQARLNEVYVGYDQGVAVFRRPPAQRECNSHWSRTLGTVVFQLRSFKGERSHLSTWRGCFQPSQTEKSS